MFSMNRGIGMPIRRAGHDTGRTPSDRRRSKPRLYESAGGPDGAGRLVERWGFLWRWETWVSNAPLARRPRGGWTLTYAAALKASEDALHDYTLKSGGPDPLTARRFERGREADSPKAPGAVPPGRERE
jgi:hypothetical protein